MVTKDTFLDHELRRGLTGIGCEICIPTTYVDACTSVTVTQGLFESSRIDESKVNLHIGQTNFNVTNRRRSLANLLSSLS